MFTQSMIVFAGAVAAGVWFTGSAKAATLNLIQNGDFEARDFAGWSVQNFGSGSWYINNGGFNPTGPALPLLPISGNFDAVSYQNGPGLRILSQVVSIPTEPIASAIFSWSDRLRNYSNVFSDPNQEWRVNIKSLDGTLIRHVFSTNPGDPTQQVGPNDRIIDLTGLFQALPSQQVKISFEQQDSLGYFNATLDNVSLLVQTEEPVSDVPEPTSIFAVLVLGAVMAGRVLSKEQVA
ncbi:hypothetical protein IQ241_22855 [Romeria aff. gracilis LEGE 07310]|uniref:PEP-CTERM sorting domain-containing protein n=1 Tax=Vasconcelosia minhoensis LEGE 07310 TaxID=915328 RepID=A0A8J7AJ94_9CYAN|nr:hypothetical protein [Romeria gracilis]MBE9080096.1 hypothetical protein [Romeria aff. gracilis LEGE 07310]